MMFLGILAIFAAQKALTKLKVMSLKFDRAYKVNTLRKF